MSRSLCILLGPSYRSLEDVITGLADLERSLLVRRDRRGAFVNAYLQITSELNGWVEARRFHDSDWVARYAVAFANRFRRALAAYERGDQAACPSAWRIALGASAAGAGPAILDLLLGINAHINHDLPFALREVGIDPDRPTKHADHTTVNAALRVVTTRIRQQFAPLYTTRQGALDRWLGDLGEVCTAVGFRVARARAWDEGVALVGARTAAAASRITARIERQSARFGRRLASNTFCPWLLDALRTAERKRPWWELLGAAPESTCAVLAEAAA